MVARYTIVNSFLQIGRQVYRKRRILIGKHRTRIFSKMSKPPKYKMLTQKLETRFWRKLLGSSTKLEVSEVARIGTRTDGSEEAGVASPPANLNHYGQRNLKVSYLSSSKSPLRQGSVGAQSKYRRFQHRQDAERK